MDNEHDQLMESTRDAIFAVADKLIEAKIFHPGHRLYLKRILPELDLIDTKVLLDHLCDEESQKLLAENLYRLRGVDGWMRELVFASEEELSSKEGDAMLSIANQMEAENWSEEKKREQWEQIEEDMFRIENNTQRWHQELDEMYANNELDNHSYTALKSFPANPTTDPIAIKTIQHFMDMGPREYHRLNVEHAKKEAGKRRRNLALLVTALVAIAYISLA